jgi:hypothetical protein
MRMAKIQKATLDPSKISGHCGRLKCCLRYEDENYLELKRKLPHRSTPVQTPKGPGKVVDTQILTQLVVVQSESGERQAWPLDDIQILKPGQKAKPVQDKGIREVPKAPADRKQDDALTRELLEMAESEQDSAAGENQAPQKQSPQDNDNRQRQQRNEGSQQQGKRQGKKKRRRRPKNKQGGSPNAQNAQNAQNKSPDQNKNRQEKQQHPSSGNTTPPSGE